MYVTYTYVIHKKLILNEYPYYKIGVMIHERYYFYQGSVYQFMDAGRFEDQ